MGLGGGRSRLRVVKRSKDDTSICTLDTKMLFQRKDQGSDVKGPPVFGENSIPDPDRIAKARCMLTIIFERFCSPLLEMILARSCRALRVRRRMLRLLVGGDTAPPQLADP